MLWRRTFKYVPPTLPLDATALQDGRSGKDQVGVLVCAADGMISLEIEMSVSAVYSRTRSCPSLILGINEMRVG